MLKQPLSGRWLTMIRFLQTFSCRFYFRVTLTAC